MSQLVRSVCAALRDRESMHVAIRKFVMAQIAIQTRLQQVRDHKHSIARKACVSARCEPCDLSLAGVYKVRLEIYNNKWYLTSSACPQGADLFGTLPVSFVKHGSKSACTSFALRLHQHRRCNLASAHSLQVFVGQ